MANKKTTQAHIDIPTGGGQVDCAGLWSIDNITALDQRFGAIAWPAVNKVTINGGGISDMDTAGAWLLRKCITKLRAIGKEVELKNFSTQHQDLLTLIGAQEEGVIVPEAKPRTPGFLFAVGKESVMKYIQLHSFMYFLGELVMITLAAVRRPHRIQWRSIVATVEDTGYRALPLVALLSFLIGIVLAYQMGLQLKNYGADIFIVDLSGLAILREFGPLITAIIIAGRTSSSFTARIGTMKVNEEVDALYSMGLSPTERLVFPKIIGLIIALPLLTVWADVWGILGSMVMSKDMLDINYYDFVSRLREVIRIKTYLIGLSKAPVFALVIAAVGCFQGFQVSFSAESVGQKTTKSVVQAIFLIIIVDAVFSVLFSWQGI